jgi:hypothetical protein
MFGHASSYYVAHPGNSREVEQEELDIKEVVRLMKPLGVEVFTQDIKRSAVNIEIRTSIDASAQVSAELLKVIASIKGELNSGYIYIKRPRLLSYFQRGCICSILSWIVFWYWWQIKDVLEMF